MSNLDPHQYPNEKLIKIKPIEMIRQHTGNGHQSETVDDEYTAIQEQLQVAREELHQAKAQKQQMIAESQEAIMKDKEEWNKTKASYIEQAKEAGYSTGFATGKQESMKQYKQLLNQANEIVHSATVDYHSTVEQSEEVIVDLAIHTAGKIIKQKITDHPSAFLAIVKAAIKEIKDQSVVTVYVHPDAYELILQQKEELRHLLHADTKLTIYVNEELNNESCVIEHPFGKIDASVDTQLTQLREVLHEVATGE